MDDTSDLPATDLQTSSPVNDTAPKSAISDLEAVTQKAGILDSQSSIAAEQAPNFWPNAPQPPDLQARMAKVASIADPHLRELVEANVRLQTQRESTAFADQQRQAKTQAKAAIDQGGDLGTIPPKLMMQIDRSGRQALIDYVTARANPVTDPVTYYRLKDQALDDPAGFQATDLTDHIAKLSARDYGELQQLQGGLKTGQSSPDLPLQQVYKANIDQTFRQFGLSATTMAGSNIDAKLVQQAAFLRQAIDQQAAATEFATGRRMSPADHEKLVQQVSM